MDRNLQDGIHGMLPAEQMPEHVRKYRAVYAKTPGAPIYHKEGWYYCAAGKLSALSPVHG
jgi:hypothetical protein